MNAEQGTVNLVDNSNQNSQFRTMVRQMDSRVDVLPYHFGLQLSGWMLKNQSPLLINDFQNDDRFKFEDQQSFNIRNLLSVPLRLKGNLIGVLNVFNKRGETGFTEEDKRLLAIIGAQSAQVIEGARLYEEEKTLLHLNEELRVAGDIQKRLLPERSPEVDRYEIIGKNIPAKEMGGDYFDFIGLKNGRLGVCLGDVSGKGITAALLMSYLQATVRSQSILNISSNEIVANTNQILHNSTDTDKFVTFFYSVLDAENNTIEVTNAGHDYPCLFSADGSLKRLNTGGPILGFMPDIPFDNEIIKFEVNSLLMVYSDGLTEAVDPNGEEFGEENLFKLVKENLNLPIKDLSDLIYSSIGIFTENQPARDDMTLVLIRRNS